VAEKGGNSAPPLPPSKGGLGGDADGGVVGMTAPVVRGRLRVGPAMTGVSRNDGGIRVI